MEACGSQHTFTPVVQETPPVDHSQLEEQIPRRKNMTKTILKNVCLHETMQLHLYTTSQFMKN